MIIGVTIETCPPKWFYFFQFKTVRDMKRTTNSNVYLLQKDGERFNNSTLIIFAQLIFIIHCHIDFVAFIGLSTVLSFIHGATECLRDTKSEHWDTNSISPFSSNKIYSSEF